MDTDSALAVHVSMASLNRKTSPDQNSRIAASLASLNTSIHTPDVDTKKHATLDRGYSWVIMVAVFANFLIHGLLVSTATILYQEILDRYGFSATKTALIVSSATSVKLLSSPFIGILYQKFSFRTMAVVGSILISLGLLLTGFATNFAMLYCGYGILVGIGGNMVIMSSLVIVAQYFLLKRGIALSFTFCGNGIGSMIFPPLVTWSFKSFGYTQTLSFMACIMMQSVITGALYRPQTFDSPTDDAPQPTTKSKWKSFVKKFGLDLLGRPILVFALVMIASLQCMVSLGQIFISGLAIERAAMSANEIATALSIAAFSDFCKLPVGFCFDSNALRPNRTYFFCMACIMMGLLAIALSFTATVISFTIVFAIYVFFASAHSQYVTILGDMVTMEEMSNTIVLCRTIMGILLLIVPLAIGRIKDLWNSFQYGFILYSIVHTGIVTFYLIAYHCWTRRKKQEEMEQI